MKESGNNDVLGLDVFYEDVVGIVRNAREKSYESVNKVMVETYWLLGKRIVQQEQEGSYRAEYGKSLIRNLAKRLTHEFGSGYSDRYLRSFRQFYLLVPDFEIWKSRFPNLSWTHIYRTLRLKNNAAIYWYLENAAREMWSVRTLSRNISTQYFERHFTTPLLSMKESDTNLRKEEILKNPVIAEFLGFLPNSDYSEKELETSILSHLKDFLMEMGRGFAFVARQQLIRTESEDYFIDLVFYNVVLKCYVLIDLKVGKITHQDVGQMDMYVRMYDELKCTEGDNPTIGIVLCSETDEDIARYSILKGNEQIFASKYKLYLPTEEELRKEIERQKEIFRLQHG